MLDEMGGWSSHRSARATPHKTGKIPGFIGAQLLGGLMTWGVFNVGTAAGLAIGRSSPQSRGIDAAGRTLTRLLTIGAQQDTARSMLPVCRRILLADSQTQTEAINQRLVRKAVTGLVRGGLPPGLPKDEREKMIELGLGNDPATRTASARTLTEVVRGRGIGKNPLNRIAAARYLYNLINAGNHQLNATEVDQAHQAILGAFQRMPRDSYDTEATAPATIIAALLNEIPREQRKKTDDTLTADGLLAQRLSSLVIEKFPTLKPQAAAQAMPEVVAAYGSLSTDDQRRADTMVQRYLTARNGRVAERGDEAQPQLAGLSLLRSLGRFSGTEPKPLLDLAGRVWPRLNSNLREAALNQLFDGFDTASPSGQAAVVGFIGRLRNEAASATPAQRQRSDNEFASAAQQLVRQVLSDEEMSGKTAPAVLKTAKDMLLERLPQLHREAASALVRSSVDGNADLPQELWAGFIAQAPRLDATALRGLLAAYGNQLPALEPEEARTLDAAWSKAMSHATTGRSTINAFMHVAADVAPSRLNLSRPEQPVDAKGATELAAALPKMSLPAMQAAIRYIGQTSLPPEVQRDMVQSVLKGYQRFRPEAQSDALKLCYINDRRLTLHALAQTVGVPQLVPGVANKFVRPAIDQAIPLADGGHTTLRDALLKQPDRDIKPALEELAKHLFSVPDEHRDAMAEVLRQRLPALPASGRERVAQTLVFNNSSLSPDQIRSVGGDPADPIWQRPQGMTHEQVERRRTELQNSRLNEESGSSLADRRASRTVDDDLNATFGRPSRPGLSFRDQRAAFRPRRQPG